MKSEDTDEFLKAWEADATYFKSQPGLISAQLHKGIGSRDLKHITRICDENDIEFYIDGNSDHYPGWTIMIEWSHKEKKEIVVAE